MEITWIRPIFYLMFLYLALNWGMGARFSFKFPLLRKNTDCAKQILDQLMTLITYHKQFQIAGRSEELVIPQYKFYTAILQAILHYSMQLGAPITDHLKSLRRCLARDWEFEQKLVGHLLSTLGQVISITLATWGFGFFCQWILQLWPPFADLLVVGGLQISGGLVFFLLYQKRKTHLFRPYEHCYHAIITAAILQQLGMSLHTVIAQCSLENLPRQGRLESFRGRLEELFRQCHQHGHSIKDFLLELREELDFYLEEDFKKFLQFTTRIKFFVLALFYFPAYLVFVFSLFGGLLPH